MWCGGETRRAVWATRAASCFPAPGKIKIACKSCSFITFHALPHRGVLHPMPVLASNYELEQGVDSLPLEYLLYALVRARWSIGHMKEKTNNTDRNITS